MTSKNGPITQSLLNHVRFYSKKKIRRCCERRLRRVVVLHTRLRKKTYSQNVDLRIFTLPTKKTPPIGQFKPNDLTIRNFGL